MSIQQNFPAILPSLNLNFARSKTLDPRITFSRTSTATRVNEQGLIEVVSADIPRFDHEYDASTGVIKSLGLLVEEQRTNSLYYSNDFSQDPLPATALQGWFKQSSHPVPTQSVVGPDGVSNSGWRFYRTATNQYILQQVAGAGTHTLSAWVRSSAATGSFTMQGYNSTDKTMATLFTATNEWQRFSITISPTTTTNYYPCIPTNINTDFYVWGAQLELNKSFETSYIPTSGGTTTRNPDDVSMVGDNFSDWYNQDEGTVFFHSQTYSTLSDTTLYCFDDGTTNQANQVDTRIGSGIFYRARVRSNAVSVADIDPGSNFDLGSPIKLAHAVKENDFAAARSGLNAVTDSSGAMPLTDRTNFKLNQRGTSGIQGRIFIRRIIYWPRRLTNTQLQNLTK
jgi:hypothetical protein